MPLAKPDAFRDARFGARDMPFRKATFDSLPNGLLLHDMDTSFWAACREHRIRVDVTVYPPVKKRLRDITALLQRHEIDHRLLERDTFWSFYRFDGEANPLEAMHNCRKHFFCPFLENGRLFPCAYPAMAKYANRALGTHIPTDVSIDIHDSRVTGWDIIEFLAHPNAACSYCSSEYATFGWSVSQSRIEEWDANVVRRKIA